jgi:hypothetical protein
MCKCRPYDRTPFCGREGCKWPVDYKTFIVKGWVQLTLKIDTEKVATGPKEAEQQLVHYIKNILLNPCDIHRVQLTATEKEPLITEETNVDNSHTVNES